MINASDLFKGECHLVEKYNKELTMRNLLGAVSNKRVYIENDMGSSFSWVTKFSINLTGSSVSLTQIDDLKRSTDIQIPKFVDKLFLLDGCHIRALQVQPDNISPNRIEIVCDSTAYISRIDVGGIDMCIHSANGLRCGNIIMHGTNRLSQLKLIYIKTHNIECKGNVFKNTIWSDATFEGSIKLYDKLKDKLVQTLINTETKIGGTYIKYPYKEYWWFNLRELMFSLRMDETHVYMKLAGTGGLEKFDVMDVEIPEDVFIKHYMWIEELLNK